MKKGIVYSFHVRHGKLTNNFCYKQLLYSITTLRIYNKTIPVKVYISQKTIDKSNEKLSEFLKVELIYNSIV
jgi:hypothetical protein